MRIGMSRVGKGVVLLLLIGMLGGVQTGGDVMAATGAGSTTGEQQVEAEVRGASQTPPASPLKPFCPTVVEALVGLAQSEGLSPTALQDSVTVLSEQQVELDCRTAALEGGVNLALYRMGLIPGLMERVWQKRAPGVPLQKPALAMQKVATELLEPLLSEQWAGASFKAALLAEQALILNPSVGPRDVENLARQWTWALYRHVRQGQLDGSPTLEQERVALGALRSALTLLGMPIQAESAQTLDAPSWSALVALARLAILSYQIPDESDWLKALGVGVYPTESMRRKRAEHLAWQHWVFALSSRPEPASQQRAAALLARMALYQVTEPETLTRKSLTPRQKALPHELPLWQRVAVPLERRFDDVDRILAHLKALASPGGDVTEYLGLPTELAVPLATLESNYWMAPDPRARSSAQGSARNGGRQIPASPPGTAPTQEQTEWQTRNQKLFRALRLAMFAVEQEQQWLNGPRRRESLYETFAPAEVLQAVLDALGGQFGSRSAAEQRALAETLSPLLLRIPLPIPVNGELILYCAALHPSVEYRQRLLEKVLRDAEQALSLTPVNQDEALGHLRRYLAASQRLMYSGESAHAGLMAPLAAERRVLKEQVLPIVARLNLLKLAERRSWRSVLPSPLNAAYEQLYGVELDKPRGLSEATCLDAKELLALEALEPGLLDVTEEADGEMTVSLREALEQLEADVDSPDKAARRLCQWVPPPVPNEPVPGCVYPATRREADSTACDPPLEARLSTLNHWLIALSGLWFESAHAAGRLGLLYPLRLVVQEVESTTSALAHTPLEQEKAIAVRRFIQQASCAALIGEGPAAARRVLTLGELTGVGIEQGQLCGVQEDEARLQPLQLELVEEPGQDGRLRPLDELSVQLNDMVCGDAIRPVPGADLRGLIHPKNSEFCDVRDWLTCELRANLLALRTEDRPWQTVSMVDRPKQQLADMQETSLLGEEDPLSAPRNPTQYFLLIPIPPDGSRFELRWGSTQRLLTLGILSRGEVRLVP